MLYIFSLFLGIRICYYSYVKRPSHCNDLKPVNFALATQSFVILLFMQGTGLCSGLL